MDSSLFGASTIGISKDPFSYSAFQREFFEASSFIFPSASMGGGFFLGCFYEGSLLSLTGDFLALSVSLSYEGRPVSGVNANAWRRVYAIMGAWSAFSGKGFSDSWELRAWVFSVCSLGSLLCLCLEVSRLIFPSTRAVEVRGFFYSFSYYSGTDSEASTDPTVSSSRVSY